MTSKEWKKYKLGDICIINMGQSPKSEFYNSKGDGLPFLQGNRTFGFMYPDFDTYTTQITKTAEPMDVIMSVRAPVGELNIVLNKVCIGRGVCSIKIKNGQQKFLYYFMKHYISHLINQGNGTVFGSVNKNDISNLEVLLPPIETQEKIARVLSSLDDKIELNNKINQNLEQQAQAIFKSWFVDFEPFDGKMPDDWKIGTISELGTVVGGSTPSKKNPEYYTNNGIAWITPKDLSRKNLKFISKGEIDITDKGFKNSSVTIMPKGTVLFSSRAPIGYISIAQNDVTTNQGFKSVIPFQTVGTPYVYLYLKNNITLIENMAAGSTFKEVSGSIMQNIPALIPSKKILKRFNTLCDKIFRKQEYLEVENEKLTQLRDTLLPKLMSGEINVDDVEV